LEYVVMQKCNVIGAGVSGLTSAIFLNRAGVKVDVFERFADVGMNVGNNCQAIRNYDRKVDLIQELSSLGINIKAKPIFDIDKYAPSGRKMNVHSDSLPLFYAVMRGAQRVSLDNQLYDIASREGVNVSFNEKKTISSGDIIAVNGLFKNMWAYGRVYTDINVDPSKILFFMDSRYCPNGYLYLIPFGENQATVASTSFDLTAPLPALFDRFVEENKIINPILSGASIVEKFSGSAYANVPSTANISGKRFVGASAGFVDPARGFGNIYAIRSGYLAAKSIIDKSDYDALWKSEFESELLKGLKRRFFLEQLDNQGYEKLIIDDKIDIKKYEKVPKSMQKLLEKTQFNMALSDWRKKFDLGKLFL